MNQTNLETTSLKTSTPKTLMSKKKFRIGELAKVLQVKKFVIRFWEKEFALKSDRSQGGQRYYTEEDFKAFNTIKFLLYTQGFTIAGAKIQLEKMLHTYKGKLPNNPQKEPTPPAQETLASHTPLFKEKQQNQIKAAIKTTEKLVPYIPKEFLEKIKYFKEQLIKFEKSLK